MIDSFTGKYSFLSNFYPCEIIFDGITYPSIEHAYQAAKTLDQLKRREISQLSTPGQAKRAGKNLELRSDWEKVRLDIMRRLLFRKFLLSDDLKEKLLSTGDQELVEGNTWGDTFWGVCNGVGENWLGKLLMEVREELKKVKTIC